MNPNDTNDDALDELLRASAPEPLVDADFVARTMAAVDRAARGAVVQRRATPVAPIAIARALAAEQQRHAAQARLWRWAIAGIVAGFLLMIVAVIVSPTDGTNTMPLPLKCFTVFGLMAAGALWAAWQELRSS